MKLWEKIALGIAISIVVIDHKIKEICRRVPHKLGKKEDTSSSSG